MTANNNHSTDSVENRQERRGRIPCWLSEFGRVIEAVAAGPRTRSNNRASELHQDHNAKNWFLG